MSETTENNASSIESSQQSSTTTPPQSDLWHATDAHHYLLYGSGGAGKTHMAATAEEPYVVLLTDGMGNARPYYEGMRVQRRVIQVVAHGKNEPLTTYRVFAQSDTERKYLKRYIYDFNDTDTDKPIAWAQFDNTFPEIDKVMRALRAKTLILDSLTTLQMAYRLHSKKWEKTTSGWDWALPLTNELEFLCGALKGKPYSTIVIAHVALSQKSNQHGHNEYVANATGRMAGDLLLLHDNVLRCYAEIGGGKYVAQTQHDGVFTAKNNVDAPAKCDNTFEAFLKNEKKVIWEED